MNRGLLRLHLGDSGRLRLARAQVRGPVGTSRGPNAGEPPRREGHQQRLLGCARHSPGPVGRGTANRPGRTRRPPQRSPTPLAKKIVAKMKAKPPGNIIVAALIWGAARLDQFSSTKEMAHLPRAKGLAFKEIARVRECLFAKMISLSHNDAVDETTSLCPTARSRSSFTAGRSSATSTPPRLGVARFKGTVPKTGGPDASPAGADRI